MTASCSDFFDVAQDLVVLVPLVGDEDDGHSFVDQRDRAVLHFRGGHALGVDVADFLELERPFHRGWIVVAASEEQPVVAVDILGGDLGDAFVGRQDLLDHVGDAFELCHETG